MSDSNSDLGVIKAGIIAVGLIVIALIIGVTFYNVNDRALMAKNIDAAIRLEAGVFEFTLVYGLIKNMNHVRGNVCHQSVIFAKGIQSMMEFIQKMM